LLTAEIDRLKKDPPSASKQRKAKCEGCAAKQEQLKKTKADLKTARSKAKVKQCESCRHKNATIKSLQSSINDLQATHPPPKRSKLTHTAPSEHEESAKDQHIVSLEKMITDKDKQIAFLQKLIDENARRSTVVQMQGSFGQLGPEGLKALLGASS
jgi:hypothetical protein